MPTLADVAKKANHPEQVTDELKELVFSAMAELDYRPNIAAKALVSNRSQIIKLFILEEIDTTEPYYMNLLMGIAKCIGKAHYSLQLVTNDAFDVGSCDGYIITGVREKDFDWIDRLEKPVVLFGENRFGYDYVDSDNHYGTAKATQYALDNGYQTIVYIGIDEDEPFELSREKGYLSIMKDQDLPSKILRFPNHSTMAENYLTENWQDFQEKTCFICSSDRLALGIVRGITKEKGRIPDDFGVIGFDGVFLDQISSPKLTTVNQDIVRMGEVCGEMLLKKIAEKGESQGYRRFFPELILRETTR